jgi:hypothetical protein
MHSGHIIVDNNISCSKKDNDLCPIVIDNSRYIYILYIIVDNKNINNVDNRKKR